MTTLPLYTNAKTRVTEDVAAQAMPPNWLPLLLWVLGVVLAAAALPLHTSKSVFWTLLVTSGVSVCVGSVLFVVYARRTEGILEARATLLKRMQDDKAQQVKAKASCMQTPPLTSLAETAEGYVPFSPAPLQKRRRQRSSDATSNANTTATIGVTWMDDNKPVGSPLSAVKTFRAEEPVNALQDERTTFVPDHDPKPVPATPCSVGLRLGYETPYSDSMTPQYIAAANTAGALNPEDAMLDTSPMFYTPPSQYPTVDDIATERQRFWCRPETPETDRQRREGGLQEAAFLLGPPRDGSMVPVTASV